MRPPLSSSLSLFCSHFLAVLLISVVVFKSSITAMRPPPQITVNKCCGENQILNEIEQEHQCTIGDNSSNGNANSSNDWWPLIVMAKKQTIFEPHGYAPRFMKFQEHQPNCTDPEFFNGPHKLVLYTNGTLYLSERHKYIELENYCIDKDSAIVCDPNARNRTSYLKNPLKKCCAHNAVYKTDQSTCVHEATTLPLSISNDGNNDNSRSPLLDSTDYDVQYGFPMCKNSKYFIFELNEFNFDRDLNQLVLKSGQTLVWNEYCVENVIVGNGTNDLEHDMRVFMCADHYTTDSNATDIRFILFPIGLLISVVFLLATLATRYILPTNHHILHWRCQTFHVVCLLIGDLLLAFTQLFGRNATHLICVSIAVSMHFFFLSAFFWLNTMCFNIYISFRDFRPNMERNQERNRLRIYKIYAFGVPLLISSIAAMRHSSSTPGDDVYLQPRFCETEYWFAGNLEKLAYFYGPVGILLFINLMLFASTARQLTCGLWKREEVKSTTERTTLSRICMKLVVVMGIVWVADILSWAHSLWYDDLYYVWIITDLINTLQGVFIWLVVGCQPQVFNVLKQMWRSKKIQFRRSNADGGQRNSSSSQVASSMGESITNNTFTTSNAKITAETMC